jgi:hypothetical protein
MRPLPLAAVLTLALSAAVSAGPRPAGVDLTETGLTVTLTNAARCEVPRPGTALAWSGTLAGCGADWSYAVTLDPGTNPAREVVRAIFADTVGMAAVGRVVLTDARGHDRVFVSPPPTAED